MKIEPLQLFKPKAYADTDVSSLEIFLSTITTYRDEESIAIIRSYVLPFYKRRLPLNTIVALAFRNTKGKTITVKGEFIQVLLLLDIIKIENIKDYEE